jgi:ABC-2 type transport system permease protein
MMFWLQLKNELIKLFARKRTYIGFGAFVAFQIALVLALEIFNAERGVRQILEMNGFALEDYYQGLTVAFFVVGFTFFILGSIYLALVGGDIVAKEVEDGTMRMALSRPVSRLQLLFIKWLGCFVFTCALVLFVGTTALVTGYLYRGGLGRLFVFLPQDQIFSMFDSQESLWRYARAVMFLMVTVQVITSTSLMFSCFNMKPAAATIVTLSVFFVDFVLRSMPFLVNYQKYFISYHVACWARTMFESPPWASIEISLIVLTAWNITAFVVGAMRFCTRDFKS